MWRKGIGKAQMTKLKSQIHLSSPMVERKGFGICVLTFGIPGRGIRIGLAALSLLALACLTPIRSVYRVEMVPKISGEGHRIDPVDSTAVYTREGLQVRVRFLRDEELVGEIPGERNPYVYPGPFDSKLGYRPVQFTVFQVAVVNPTFPKVQLNPEQVLLKTDRGKTLYPYAITLAEAQGRLRNFETYFLSKGIQTGNAQALYLERMGLVRETIYHRDAPVFKGNTYTGKIIFDALPPETTGVTLVISDFILRFGVHDEPEEFLSVGFPFGVQQGIRNP